MAIPKRVRSDKRIVWHKWKFQVYLKNDVLQYQDEKGLRKEILPLMSYEEILGMSWWKVRCEELNKYPFDYFEKFDSEWYIVRDWVMRVLKDCKCQYSARNFWQQQWR